MCINVIQTRVDLRAYIDENLAEDENDQSSFGSRTVDVMVCCVFSENEAQTE